MTSLTFEAYESPEAVAALEPVWRQLHADCTYPSVFNGFDFFMASTLAFPAPDSAPYVLVARDRENLVAIFPFQSAGMRRGGLRLRLLEYAAQWETDKPYPLIRRGYEPHAWRELARFLAANRKHWHLFDLVEMREGLTGLSELPRLFRLPRYWVRVRDDFSTPLVALDGSWEARWRAHPKMRKKVARMENAFGDRLRFEVRAGPDDWEACLTAYRVLEAKGWKAGSVGIGRDEPTLSFYRDLFSRLAVRDGLRFGLLFVDEALVAAEIAYVEGRTVYFAHGTYDEGYAKYSPGMVSTSLFLRHFHESDCLEGDYLAGFTGYLLPWADRVLPSHHLTVVRLCAPVLYVFVLKAFHRLLKRREKGGQVADGWMPSSWRQPR
ncbi:GNAT family N-acetyltransferase [Thiocystis violacea]|uniref:GNAT family N-acetyltransferase n=1 Tax=Thiocystis violacea TaxID=13725 RepID=UPI00190667CD|nr:GNAT family N-acetyltransferase [Thiocystis violacea]MBK1717780.1 hypothetical protein [Thiocystis violacea]